MRLYLEGEMRNLQREDLMRTGEYEYRRRLGSLLCLVVGMTGLFAVNGCAGTSDEIVAQQRSTQRDMATLQQNTQRDIAALRTDLNTMQRNMQTRMATLEREARSAIDQSKEKERSATSSRKIEADTAELKRAVDRYADKTKQMLASLIQAFVDAANEMQVDNPQRADQMQQQTPSSVEPQDRRSLEPQPPPRALEPQDRTPLEPQEPRSLPRR
jgi:Skp family chaperone for outer membrane proteins